ncbi:MAG: carboxypeptidase regulatory-like domain-containing protein, partial [Candidatus Electryoneaceae bacterium]|nr:carboxypeptidase regulatory-like domain-containing protein [Candidatus Electryoneaceae bacterium]
MPAPSLSYRCSRPLVVFVLLLVSYQLFASGINTGLLVSQANQDAELELEDVPRSMTEPADTVTIRWTPEVRGILRYSPNFAGNDPQNYNHRVEEPLHIGDGILQFLGEQLPVGRIFCIIVEDTDDDARHSTVFNILRVPDNAPEMIAPISGAGREGINTVTPTFRWEAVAGVPYYHIVMSDQAFVIIEDEETGEIRVEGANLIWAAITPQTSIQYGVPDPSEYFDNDNTPPLVGNTDRDDRPRYSWVVLNNFGNHPGYSSTVVGGIAGFEVEVEPPFGEAENIEPEDGISLADEEILFRWTGVREAASYFIYVALEEISPGGSRAFVPAWSSQTTLTSITCPAEDMLTEGRYVWKILAADRQGRGTLSDTTSFSYSIASGFVAFNTYDINEDPLEFVEISAEPINGAGIQDFSTNDAGYYDRLIPVGTYIFYGNKDGYEEAVSEELTIEEDERYSIEFTLELVPSSILGRVVDGDGVGVSGATVTGHPIDGGDDARMETNISGEYQIVALPGRWVVSATARGHSPSDTLVIEVLQGENIDLEDRLAVEAYRFTVSGYVRNGDDQPINLATVILIGEDDVEHRAFTPESGRYEFAVGTGVWTLSAIKPGFYLEEGPTDLEVIDRDVEVNLTLLPQAGIISGRVLIDGNQANREVDVWLIPSAGDIVVAETNQRGTFSQGVFPGDYRVFPVLQGYNAADTLNISVGPGETLSGLVLELEATEVYIIGTVVDNDDEPLTNVEISSGGMDTQTDQSGNYRLGVFPGTHTVTAQRYGYVTEELGPFEIEGGNDLEDVNFELSDNAGTISGQIRRGNDRIFDATVTAIRGEQISTTHTDRNGEYSFGLVFGTYLVTARCEGFIADEPDTLEVRVQPGQEVCGRDFIMLRYIGRITGTVRTPGGEPIRSPSVRIVELGDPDNSFNGVGNVEGRFSVGVPPECRYIVTIIQEGYAGFCDTTDVLEIDGEYGLGIVTLAPLPCQISGVVTAVDEPLGSVNIRVEGEEETYTGQTDRNGGFRFDIETGSYHITASKPGYTVAETDIRLGPGQRRDDVDFTLEENFALLTGGTYDPDEESIVDVMVSLIDNATDHVVFMRRTDENGLFGFDRVIPGNYRLESEHQRYEDGSLNLGAIIAGQRCQGLDMTLLPMDGMIRGSVTADDNSPIDDATVYVTAEDDSRLTAQTDDQGDYIVLN